MSSPGVPTRRRWSRARRLALGLLLAFAILAAGEVVARAAFAPAPVPYAVHPYFRIAGVFRIFLVGASTTENMMLPEEKIVKWLVESHALSGR